MATENNKCLLFKRIEFSEILPVWQCLLWPDRESVIETHSAMAWPCSDNPDEIDMKIFEYQPTFWGAYRENKLVGVNSGHRTTLSQYRSRGIWVDPDHRRQGIAQTLFALTEHQAVLEKCEMMWSMPRISALGVYQTHGFICQGNVFETETSPENIYVKKDLI
ncbi:MAG: GNAT family N-acetyltransferase [Gammaproteobacteria bacterium]|nr:GNAT family N-acetyltransferase [Gammaproteobacteria bacterium]